MSYSRSPAPRSPAPSSSGAETSMGAPMRAGAGNAAAAEKLAGGPGDRPTNLHFGFKRSFLQSHHVEPASVKDAALDSTANQTKERTKDGETLTDSENLWVVTDRLVAMGLKDGDLAAEIEKMFFDRGGNTAADKVTKVILSGNEVRVEFSTGDGHHFVGGRIMPIIGTRPADYTGLDTNARGSQVDHLQAMASERSIPREGTFLARNAALVESLFLASRQGSKFALNPTKFPPSSTEYKQALADFQVTAMYDYIDKGTFYVKTQLGKRNGRSDEQLGRDAMDAVLAWPNKGLGAVPHTNIELQDEAIVQRVLALPEYGVKYDVDTDAEQLRVGTP
ncbi:MAG: hypothetical protein H6742_00750 [Alphaproteobacteria bacterium]|nr:hypothetical protein [Alphaproteobacteria bacterium]